MSKPEKPETFAELIQGWPCRKGETSAIKSFAVDAGLPNYMFAATMRNRNVISVRWWPQVLRAAGKLRLDLSEADLVAMYRNRKRKIPKRRPRGGSRQASGGGVAAVA